MITFITTDANEVRMTEEFKLKQVKDAFNLIVVEPSSVKDTAPVSEVVEKMLSGCKSSSVYVVDGNNKLLGMITLSELLRITTAKAGMMGTDSFSANKVFKYVLSKSAKDIMLPPVSTTPNEPLVDALVDMLDNDLDDLAVVDAHGALIGELNGHEILVAAKSLYEGKNIKKEA